MNINELKSNGKKIVQSKIDGDFNGFDDEILFPLFNGQYWIQKDYKYWYHYAYMPTVTIYQLNNQHYLVVDGQPVYVEVEQIIDVQKRIIVSDFNGWSGDSIFEMDNGQIWKQDTYDYNYTYSHRPEAIIFNSGISYKMLVEGESINVKRIK